MSQMTADQAIAKVQQLLRRGDPVGAINLTSKIVQQAPQLGIGQFEHARALMRVGRTAASRRLLGALLPVANDASKAAIELETARAFLAEDRPADAVGPAERARDAMPESGAAAAVLAMALALSGRAGEASAALDAAPDDEAATVELAHARGVAAIEGVGDAAAAVEGLNEATGRVGAAVPELRDALRTLGELHARAGADDEAFTTFRRAAKLAAPGVDHRPHAKGVDAVIDAWSKASSLPRLDGEDATGDGGDRFVIAVGVAGAGSDAVGVLAAAGGGRRVAFTHALLGSAVATLPSAAAGFARVLTPPAKATRPQLRNLRRAALQAAFAEDADAPAAVDSAWGQLYGLGVIPLVTPDAKVVIVERDPADAALACTFSEAAPRCPFANDIVLAAGVQHDQRRLISHGRSMLEDAGVATLAVDYEGLVGEDDATRSRLLAFLGLSSDGAAVDAARAAAEGLRGRLHATPGVAKRFGGRLLDLRRALESVADD